MPNTFSQEMMQVQVNYIPTVVNNKPSNNVAITVGLLQVAHITEEPDGKFHIKSLWPHNFPLGTHIHPNVRDAIAAVKVLLQVKT